MLSSFIYVAFLSLMCIRISSLIPDQLQPRLAHADSKCSPGTVLNAFHAENALCTIFPFPGIIGNIYIHWAHAFALSARNAFLFVTLYPYKRIIAHRLQEHRDGTNVLTECSVVLKSICKDDANNIVEDISNNKRPEHDSFKVPDMCQK